MMAGMTKGEHLMLITILEPVRAPGINPFSRFPNLMQENCLWHARGLKSLRFV